MSATADVQVTNDGEPGMKHGMMGWRADAPDKFLSAPAERNKEFITDGIARILADAADGIVVEVGSGSGQHVALLALKLPKLQFQPTEYAGLPNPRAKPQDVDKILGSVAAYCSGMPNVLTPLPLDGAALATSPIAPDGGLRAIVCINVVHLSPLAVLDGVIAGASAKLCAGGWLFFYGPWARDGDFGSEGNVIANSDSSSLILSLSHSHDDTHNKAEQPRGHSYYESRCPLTPLNMSSQGP